MPDSTPKQLAITTIRHRRSTVYTTGATWGADGKPHPQCPTEIKHYSPSSEQDIPLSELSTCPWIEQQRVYDNQYPEVLTDVKCICETCIGRNSSKELCKKISYPIPVLKLVNERKCKFDVEEVRIGTGCTCAGQGIIEPASVKKPEGKGKGKRKRPEGKGNGKKKNKRNRKHNKGH